MENRILSYNSISRFKHLLICTLSVTLLAATGAKASTIIGDPFQVDGSVSGETFGPVFGIAGQNMNPVDIEVEVNGIFVSVNWVDKDSFDVLIEQFAGTGEGADITLSDLNFKTSGGEDEIIVGASFNPNANAYTSFFRSDDNPTGANRPADPVVNFTENSVNVVFGSDWSEQLIADQPELRFDVQAVVIPEPGTLAMLLVGLVGLGLIRQRIG